MASCCKLCDIERAGCWRGAGRTQQSISSPAPVRGAMGLIRARSVQYDHILIIQSRLGLAQRLTWSAVAKPTSYAAQTRAEGRAGRSAQPRWRAINRRPQPSQPVGWTSRVPMEVLQPRVPPGSSALARISPKKRLRAAAVRSGENRRREPWRAERPCAAPLRSGGRICRPKTFHSILVDLRCRARTAASPFRDASLCLPPAAAAAVVAPGCESRRSCG